MNKLLSDRLNRQSFIIKSIDFSQEGDKIIHGLKRKIKGPLEILRNRQLTEAVHADLLNKRSSYICFHKWVAHVWTFTVIYFFLPKKKITHALNLHCTDSMFVLNRPQYVIAAQIQIVISPTHFNRRHLNCY